MIRVAIVGNIASGKSTVERILSKNGFKTLDTDEVTHELLDKTPEIRTVFENFDIYEDGKISRRKLGAVIFSDPEMKLKLEQILHPLIREEIKTFFDKNGDEKAVFVSVPLLFEVGMEGMFDKIIFVEADDDVRLKRLMARNNYTIDEAKRRMESQQPQSGKVAKADFVIKNSAGLHEVERQILTLIAKPLFDC